MASGRHMRPSHVRATIPVVSARPDDKRSNQPECQQALQYHQRFTDPSVTSFFLLSFSSL